MLEEIARRCGIAVQMLAAQHQNASQELLRYLASRDDFGVRLYVANNPRTPLSVLGELTNMT